MPVSIPPFTNVPAPNDPVSSPWAQELTQFAVDLIAIQDGQPASANAELWYDTDDAGVSFPNMPRGYVKHALATGPPSGIGAAETDLTGANVQWTADPSRRYRTTAMGYFRQATAAGEQYLVLADGANTRLQSTAITVSLATGIMGHALIFIESGLSGTITRKLRASVGGGSMGAGTAPYSTTILVEDIGGV